MSTLLHKLESKTLRLTTKVASVVAVLLLSTLVVAPFYLSRLTTASDGRTVWQLITTHDLPNLVPMMEQFDRVLRSGVAYPRWNPDFNLGYGTATANFYPPGTFYVTSLINAVVNDWVLTLFILSVLSLAASFLAFYALARTFYGRLASLVAALLYTVLPYHQLDLYWRGAIPEFLGFAFMPVILFFVFKLGSEGHFRYYGAVGLLHGIYLMTHLPVGYLYTYTLAIYAVLWGLRDRDKRIVLRIAGGMTISLLVSAIYWLPAALEGKYVYEWASEVFPYHEHYITMLPVYDAFSKYVQEVFDYNALALIATLAILLGLPKYSVSNNETPVIQDKRTALSQSQTKLWIILGILTPFMSTSFSIHFSKLIPKIQIAVPPFRWLAISCMFTSLLVAASIDLLRKRQVRRSRHELAYKLALSTVIVLNVWLTANGIIRGGLSQPTFSPAANFIDSGFTPRNSTRPDKIPSTSLLVLTPEGGATEVIKWLPTHREIAVRVDQPSELRIKTYNFPGWTARVDGAVVPMLSDQDGVQQIAVPPGVHRVQATFENTPPRTIGVVVSSVGLLITLGLITAGQIRKRGTGKPTETPNLRNTEDQDRAQTVTASAPTFFGSLTLHSKRFGALVVALLIGAAILVVIMRTNSGGGDQSNSEITGGAASATLGAGSDARLFLAGRESVAVVLDERVSGELLAAISTKDQGAIDALIRAGKVLNVDNNTRVRVLQTSAGQAQVRILEGPHAMIEGWIPERWLK